jgi:hypothetical protein
MINLELKQIKSLFCFFYKKVIQDLDLENDRERQTKINKNIQRPILVEKRKRDVDATQSTFPTIDDFDCDDMQSNKLWSTKNDTKRNKVDGHNLRINENLFLGNAKNKPPKKDYSIDDLICEDWSKKTTQATFSSPNVGSNR